MPAVSLLENSPVRAAKNTNGVGGELATDVRTVGDFPRAGYPRCPVA